MSATGIASHLRPARQIGYRLLPQLANARQRTPLGAVELLKSETLVDLVRDGQLPRFVR